MTQNRKEILRNKQNPATSKIKNGLPQHFFKMLRNDGIRAIPQESSDFLIYKMDCHDLTSSSLAMTRLEHFLDCHESQSDSRNDGIMAILQESSDFFWIATAFFQNASQ